MSEIDRTQRRNSAIAMAPLAIPFGAIGFMLAALVGLPKWSWLPFGIGFGGLSAAAIFHSSHTVANFSARFVSRFIAPSGSTTPYQQTFSYEKSLAIRGDVDGAVEAFDAHLAAHPLDVVAHIEAAELCARYGRPARAAEILHAMRRIPKLPAARDLYVTRRLADLYAGPLDDRGRMLVELRRLVTQHAGSREAEFAKIELGREKAEG